MAQIITNGWHFNWLNGLRNPTIRKVLYYSITTIKHEYLGRGGKLEWVNDGFCDDMNNNEACQYDGGDCCGVYVNRRFCLECKCISKSYNLCKTFGIF